MSNSNKSGGGDLGYWLLTVIAFIVFWPLGLILLFHKLNRADGKKAAQKTARKISKQMSKNGETRRNSSAPVKASSISPNPGRGFIIGGGIMTVVFGFATLEEFFFWGLDYLYWAIQDAAPTFLFTGLGVGLVLWGLHLNKRNRAYRKLLTMVGQQDAVDIRVLAKAAGCSYESVQNTLQNMIDAGLFGDYAFLDLSTGRLVLTSDGLTPPPQRPVQEEVKTAPQEDDDILLQIRKVNDDIDDEAMSDKIDRIESITRRILSFQKEHPDRASQLRSFLSYYLPTTLKILNAYAELEEQGIEGENISAAKSRIEAMMDKVVEGFETQLDKLYADDLIDITSDITVMERMMTKDGLSGTVFGPKVEEAPAQTPPPKAVPVQNTGASAPISAGAAVQAAPPEPEKPVDPTDLWL